MARIFDTFDKSTWFLLILFASVLIVPFALRPKQESAAKDALTLTIISPHNEAIRYEFERAFSQWHYEKYGQHVDVDWRNLGGTSEIGKYIASQYTAAFKNHWIQSGREWNGEVASSFNNYRIDLDDESLPATVRKVREAFLYSKVTIGIDLFFGGGEYDHSKHAQTGHSVPSGYRETPEGQKILNENLIPEKIAGERWYDDRDRWYGATVSSFGICYNEEALSLIPGARTPIAWRDLGRPALFGTIALADPTKSGSITKAFEMVIQQEMADAVIGISSETEEYSEKLGEGWKKGLNTIQLASANARYFTDSASKVTLDVAMADAAAGMCIDFYGQFQAETVERPDGTSRMHYVSPLGGTTVSCDPIAMLRGAPHRELALRFIVFTLSMEGQKLWGYNAGAPGGPEKYTLHRLPIRKDFYIPEHMNYFSSPDENPYRLANSFTYHGEWTGRLFGIIRLLIRTMCMDTSEELKDAWETIIENGGPEACGEAMKILHRLPDSATYEGIFETLYGLDRKTDEVVQARLWTNWFAAQYKKAKSSAEKCSGETE